MSSPVVSRRLEMDSSSTSFVPFLWMTDTRTRRDLEEEGGVGGGGGTSFASSPPPPSPLGTTALSSNRAVGSPSEGTPPAPDIDPVYRQRAVAARDAKANMSLKCVGGGLDGRRR